MSFSSQKSKTSPLFSGTDFSSAEQGGKFSLDPSIRGFEDQALQGISGAAGRFGGQISQLRESALGNLPQFVDAQVAPLQQEVARQRGLTERTIGQRGLGGSSFGGQLRQSGAFEGERALQNARAGALAGGVGQIANLSQQELQAAGITPEMMLQISKARTGRELAPLLATGQESSESGFKIPINPLNLFGG